MNKIICLLATFLFLTSCKTMQTEKDSDLNYMQNIEQIAIETAKKLEPSIQVGDQLVIAVAAKDLDVVRPFNQNYSSGETVQQSQLGGNTPSLGTATIAGPTYIVDSNGAIDFPVLGQLDTTGKTMEEFRDELKSKLKRYIIEPSVNIRLANFKISVLGEVNRQGEYIIPNGRATLLNALGMAGDLTMYGKRDDVLIVRNVNGEIIKGRVNLLNADFINSPYYNLTQGDVIYVSANQTKEKTARLNPNAGLYIGIASIVVTILALVFK